MNCPSTAYSPALTTPTSAGESVQPWKWATNCTAPLTFNDKDMILAQTVIWPDSAATQVN